jgi:dTDP-glucose 4,6-dehydratase
MKTGLVTGAAGFIGSNYIRHLFASSSFTGKVINLDKLTYAGNLESLADIQESLGGTRYFFEQVDISDTLEVQRVFKHYPPDTIVNFSANRM